MEYLNLSSQESGSKNKSEIHFENVHITPDEPLRFKVRAVKQPIEIHSGDRVGSNGIVAKIEGAAEDLMKEAEKLKELPENERINVILELVRSKLIFPYADIIEKAKIENPELGEWLEKRFGANPKFIETNLNEYLDKGYGDCKIMAVAYLLAAQVAGLKGVYESNITPIKNLKRPNTSDPIFKSIELNHNYPTISHAWVEVQLGDGTWVPVDVVTNIIGVGEMLQLMKDAGYNTPIRFVEKGVPTGLYLDRGNWDDSSFGPGESETDLEMSIKIKKDFKTKEPVIPEFSGDINLKFLSSEDNKSVEVQIIQNS